MEEEPDGPLIAGLVSVAADTFDDGVAKELRGDMLLPSGRGLIPCDEPESLAAYPITLPSMPLSFATVLWDVPSSPTASTDLSPGTDGSSVADELSISDGVSPDWVVNPLSLVPPTPTDCVVADGVLPDGNGVTLPQSETSQQQQQHAELDKQVGHSCRKPSVVSMHCTLTNTY